MNPYNFSVLCFGFCSLLVGLLVWLKRQDQIGGKYLHLSMFYTAWAIFISILFSDNVSYKVALYAGRIGNCFAAFISVAWLHFCLVFTGKIEGNKKQLSFFYLSPILICFFTPTAWFIPSVRPFLSFKFIPVPGPAYYFMTLSYFVFVVLGFWTLYERIRDAKGVEKEQTNGLFWASVIGYLGGSLTFLPIYGIPFPQYGLFLMPIYPFALAYFMIKQKLFEIEEFAQAAHRDKLTAIGVLAASINHEIKNPLFIIKGLAESCLERQKEGIFSNKDKALESANDAMKRSMEQADRAMDIIKRLSMFSKAGIEGEMKFEAISVSEVLEDILPLVRYELAANSITLTREIPRDLPEVQADRRYLEEIFFNLIVNAIQAITPNSPSRNPKVNWASPGNLQSKEDGRQGKDAGKPGEIKVSAEISTPSLGLSRGDRDGVRGSDKVIIAIQDNGPGIPAEKLKDVFRPFYTTKAEGTGLGLYITQQLVEKIGGRISVESQSGIGTTFTVRLACFSKQ